MNGNSSAVPCKGRNCSSALGTPHSPECLADYEAATKLIEERVDRYQVAVQEALEPQRAPITEVEKEMNDPDLAKLENWFTYHKPTEEQVQAYEQLRDGAYMLARCFLLHCPPSADRTAALRKLREALMTANASIACGGK